MKRGLTYGVERPSPEGLSLEQNRSHTSVITPVSANLCSTGLVR